MKRIVAGPVFDALKKILNENIEYKEILRKHFVLNESKAKISDDINRAVELAENSGCRVYMLHVNEESSWFFYGGSEDDVLNRVRGEIALNILREALLQIEALGASVWVPCHREGGTALVSSDIDADMINIICQ